VNRLRVPDAGEEDRTTQVVAERPRVAAGRTARAAAWLIVGLRWLVVPAWLAAAVYVAVSVPTQGDNSKNVINLVPSGAPAVRVAAREQRLFRVPLGAETEVVQYHANGMSAAAQAQSIAMAASVDRHELGRRSGPRYLAIPIPNTLKLAPTARAAGTTIITYLEYPPSLSSLAVVRGADTYAHALERRSGDVVGVTGIIPAEWQEGTLIQDHLTLVEIATVLVIALLVGLKFRSLGAPLLTLVTVGVANLCTDEALRWAQTYGGISVPPFLKPMQVALVLGVGTDYCVFFLSAYRHRARTGEPRVPAARAVAAEITPIVVVGGLILAAGLTSLEVARVAFFRDLGPALALTVLVTLLVAITFVPSVIALLGRLLLWPGGLGEARLREQRQSWIAGVLTRRWVAGIVVVAGVAALSAAASGLRHLHVGFTEVTGLPSTAQERSAYQALQRGFAPGMLSPTRIVVAHPGITNNLAGLTRLQAAVAGEPGVQSVIGPSDQPLGDRLGLVYSSRGDAARYVVVLKHDPFSAAGLQDVARLRSDLPHLVSAAGLHGTWIGVTGDTALAQETTAAMRADVLRISIVVLAVSVILLAIFLRALLAPLLLVAASALSVAATLGIATFIFSDLLGYGELTYYVPYASAVLLVSLSSDYNVFVTGRMWQEARRRPLAAAVATAGTRAASAVRTAGLALGASFAALAIIPVRGFRELAFAMTLGIALETFVVRSLLVPSLVVLFGYPIGWPGRALRRGAAINDAPAGD
jgi:putative drug exporter of the RND superfamily